jgi:hypothetical protein
MEVMCKLKAVFKKTNYILLVVCLILALIWSGVCAFLIIENNITGVINLLVAIIMCAFGVIPFLYNYKAYLHINDNKIISRFGFFKRLECDITDVTFVLPRFDTMHILLKDRKHYIMGIKNAYEIGAFIMQRIPFLPYDNRQDVIVDVKKRNQSIKKNSVLTFCAIGLSFAWVFITVFLTGARDLPKFNNTDWIIFSIMCFLEVLTVIAMFTFAIKARRGNPVRLEEQIYKIKRSTIETTPLLSVPGRIKSVLADPFFSHRITVCCNIIENNDEAFFYHIEIFNEDFNLKFLYQSKIFEGDEISEMFEGCLDITEKFM